MATPNSGFFVGQIGAQIRLDTEDDVSLLAAATTKEIWYKRPSTGITGAWTASLDGTKLVYTTLTVADLPVAGEYKVQVYLEGPSYKLTGKIASMVVEEPVKSIT
jgi:hypothetical protein